MTEKTFFVRRFICGPSNLECCQGWFPGFIKNSDVIKELPNKYLVQFITLYTIYEAQSCVLLTKWPICEQLTFLNNNNPFFKIITPSIPIGLKKRSLFETMIKTTKRQNVGHSIHPTEHPLGCFTFHAQVFLLMKSYSYVIEFVN